MRNTSHWQITTSLYANCTSGHAAATACVHTYAFSSPLTSSPQESRYGAGSKEPSSQPTHNSMEDLAIKKGPADRLHKRACADARFRTHQTQCRLQKRASCLTRRRCECSRRSSSGFGWRTTSARTTGTTRARWAFCRSCCGFITNISGK